MIIDALCEFDNDNSSGGNANGLGGAVNALSAGLSANATTASSSYSYDTFLPGVPAPNVFVGASSSYTAPLSIGGPLLHDIGRGAPLNLLIQVTTALASTASATIAVDFIESASPNLGTPTVLESTPLIGISASGAASGPGIQGYRFPLKTVPMKCLLRYVGLQYRNGTAPISAGGIEATMATVADDHTDAFGS